MIGQFIKKAVWWTFVAMCALALYRSLPQNPSDLFAWAKEQEVAVKTWYADNVDPIKEQIKAGKFGQGDGSVSGSSSGSGSGSGSDSGAGSDSGSGSGSDSGSGSSGGGSAAEYTLPESFVGNKDESFSSLDGIPSADAADVAYNRDEWKHWIAQGPSCWNTREEVLYRDAQPGTQVLTDKNGKPTTDKAKACAITGGAWDDPYTGRVITNPKSLDIDHLVPLGEAAKSGGQEWDAKRKEAYANNLDDPTHLVAVDSSSNRAKGDGDPSVWKPSNEAAWCGYATDWIKVKSGWGLTVDDAERDALKEMLDTCP